MLMEVVFFPKNLEIFPKELIILGEPKAQEAFASLNCELLKWSGLHDNFADRQPETQCGNHANAASISSLCRIRGHLILGGSTAPGRSH